jgi:hypothetical protein
MFFDSRNNPLTNNLKRDLAAVNRASPPGAVLPIGEPTSGDILSAFSSGSRLSPAAAPVVGSDVSQ